jgi:hypothetical protein
LFDDESGGKFEQLNVELEDDLIVVEVLIEVPVLLIRFQFDPLLEVLWLVFLIELVGKFEYRLLVYLHLFVEALVVHINLFGEICTLLFLVEDLALVLFLVEKDVGISGIDHLIAPLPLLFGLFSPVGLVRKFFDIEVGDILIIELEPVLPDLDNGVVVSRLEGARMYDNPL